MKTGRIDDIDVHVEVVLGDTSLPVRRLAEIQCGSIIELSSLAGEPVSLVAGGECIARGEVVVIDENFGIRVTELVGKEGAR